MKNNYDSKLALLYLRGEVPSYLYFSKFVVVLLFIYLWWSRSQSQYIYLYPYHIGIYSSCFFYFSCIAYTIIIQNRIAQILQTYSLNQCASYLHQFSIFIIDNVNARYKAEMNMRWVSKYMQCVGSKCMCVCVCLYHYYHQFIIIIRWKQKQE